MSPVPAPIDRGVDGRMTDPRRRALVSVLRAGTARISNVTDIEAGSVYWQTADWMLGAGLAEHPGRRPKGAIGNDHLRLTDRGRRVAETIDASIRRP